MSSKEKITGWIWAITEFGELRLGIGVIETHRIAVAGSAHRREYAYDRGLLEEGRGDNGMVRGMRHHCWMRCSSHSYTFRDPFQSRH
jgi:hypothetical protein